MEDRIVKCDICEKVLSIASKKYSDIYGITWTFGYSKGGWGSRQDKPNFTGEVCKECYNYYMDLTDHFNKELLFSRKGKNKQTVDLIK